MARFSGSILSNTKHKPVEHHEGITAFNAGRNGRKTMVTLTAEMIEVFAKNKPYAIATASKSGIPNVAPMSTVQIVADDTIWIGDNYMVKTLANVKENPHLALYIWDPEKKRCFQIKGTVTVKTSGPDYEKIKAQIKAKGPHYPAKGLLIVKVTEVFDCTPGPNAGKKVE
jgi:predicted pyridoxine 5'-phosphate oxidase superfamily flavin-nucleotide-binding protein